MTKESAQLLLAILAKVTINPLAQNADAEYAAIAKARDELMAIVKEGETNEPD